MECGSIFPPVGEQEGGVAVKTWDVILFPNPASNLVWIKSSFDEEELIVKITDPIGRLIKTEIIKIKGNLSFLNLELNNGIYFVTLVNAKGEQILKKLVISK